MTKTHYPYWYRLDAVDGYLVWYIYDSSQDHESDGVLLDDVGLMRTFPTLARLHAFAEKIGITVESDMVDEPLDLDLVQQWLDRPRKTTVDCPTFLNAWNLFSDIATTIEGCATDIDDGKELKIYDKLFWGTNIPALTPPGKHYEPIWTKSEVSRLLNVFRKGMNLFRERLSR